MTSSTSKISIFPCGPKKPPKMTTRSFPTFHKEWLHLLKTSLLPLLRRATAARSRRHVTLLRAAMVPSSRLLSLQVRAVLHHFQAYFHALDSAAAADPSQILSPPWRAPLESSLLWFGDLHPSLFLNLLRSLLGEDAGEALREEVREMECKVRRRAPLVGEMHKKVQLGFLEKAAGEFVERGEIFMDADVAGEMTAVFLQANKLRKDVLEDIVGVLDDCLAAAFLEKLCELVLRLGDEGLCGKFKCFRVSN